jgi:magnesium chelatase family protein
LVRALEIAAAGGHSLIAYGPPGCGKTLAIRRFPSLLPDLDRETAVTVTRIHGIAGRNGEQMQEGPLIRRPPFREPHQNTSLEGMTGGGKNCLPGEISLAHGGALFLDEATLFRTSVLQSLRTPLETGVVTVSRAGRSNTFPSRFQLLMAVNPCPCGNFGSAGKICTCLPEMIERYWKRMTAPLLDRVDLRVSLSEPGSADMTGDAGFSTAELRAEITMARTMQRARNTARNAAHGGLTGAMHNTLNANLEPGDIASVCVLSPAVKRLFESGMEAAHLSGRGAHSLLKTARTIADLEGSQTIREEHVLESMQFRRWTGMIPDFLED